MLNVFHRHSLTNFRIIPGMALNTSILFANENFLRLRWVNLKIQVNTTQTIFVYLIPTAIMPT